MLQRTTGNDRTIKDNEVLFAANQIKDDVTIQFLVQLDKEEHMS